MNPKKMSIYYLDYYLIMHTAKCNMGSWEWPGSHGILRHQVASLDVILLLQQVWVRPRWVVVTKLAYWFLCPSLWQRKHSRAANGLMWSVFWCKDKVLIRPHDLFSCKNKVLISQHDLIWSKNNKDRTYAWFCSNSFFQFLWRIFRKGVSNM